MSTLKLDNVASLAPFAPELGLIAAVVLVLLWDLVAPRAYRVLGAVALTIGALGFSGGAGLFALLGGAPSRLLFNGLLSLDPYANLFRVLFAAVTIVVVLFVLPEKGSGSESERGPGGRELPEMLVLMLVVALGMNLMAESRNLLMLYLALEMVSVMSFVLAAYKPGDAKSAEGALKYVVFGGVASGVMLYGMSWLYGVTGSLDLGECSARVVAMTGEAGRVPAVVVVAVVCMLAGFGYKISAAPFHMWAPDVYEGSPTPVTAFLSVGPKAAGFAMLVRFFADALSSGVASGAAVTGPWPALAGCLAIATMTIGNFTALNQTNLKRMLAFSSVAHAGYMLLGFAVFTPSGVAALVFYAVTYAIMNLGAFLVVMAVAEKSGGDETLGAFAGLGRRAPLTALAMAIFLFSLTGLPPFAGFIGKFYIFAALVRAGGAWNWLLAVVGVLNSVVALFYYVRVARAMYLEQGPSSEPTAVRRLFGVTSVALAVPVLVLGVYWGPLYDFVERSLTIAR